MKPVRTWVVVADGARARIFLNTGPGKGLIRSMVGDLSEDHPQTRELGSDRPGRVHDRFGPGRHGLSPRADWHEQGKEGFARKVAEVLNGAGQKRDYDRLVLVAPPRTLGNLRRMLDKSAADRVVAEVAKDLTGQKDQDVAGHLGEVLPL